VKRNTTVKGEHIHLHTRKNGVQVYVTTAHRDRLYKRGDMPANYPVPAIPLQVKYDYPGCVNVDDVTDRDDPVIVYFYDSWNKEQVECFTRDILTR
jgi:hypothetical protein